MEIHIFEKVPPLVLTHGIELTSCFLPWVSPLLNNPSPPHDLPAHSEGFGLSSSCSGRFLTVGPSLLSFIGTLDLGSSLTPKSDVY